MPLVEAFCEGFNLMVEDPQEDTMQSANAARLIQSWRAHNAGAVAAMAGMAEDERPVLHYLSEERATEWWRFMRVRDKIEANLTEDLFVPSIFAALNPARQPYTFIVWPNAIPQFFPRCDYVCMKRETKRLFETKEEMGLVAYDAVIAAIGALLDDYEFDGQSIKYLSLEEAIVVAPVVQKLPLQPEWAAVNDRLDRASAGSRPPSPPRRRSAPVAAAHSDLSGRLPRCRPLCTRSRSQLRCVMVCWPD